MANNIINQINDKRMEEKSNTWNYCIPNFEFTTDLPIESSAWSGHYFFAYDLVSNTKPKVIVELGTHKGNSLFSMAQAIKDAKLNTKLYAVDTWEGDPQAGFYGEEVYKDFIRIKKKYYANINITPLKMLFDKAVNEFQDNSIDLLHIDGLHTYEAVKHDFKTWLPKVNKSSGIILLHDVCEKSEDFGVYKLWAELQKKNKNITFEHSHGLGVLILGKQVLKEDILLKRYYELQAEKTVFLKQINEKEAHIKNLTTLNISKSTQIRNVKKENNTLKTQLEEKEIHIRNITAENLLLSVGNTNETSINNYCNLRQTRAWKIFLMYLFSSKYFKNFFINLYKDGPFLTFKRIFLRVKNLYRNKKQIAAEMNPYKYWLKNHNIGIKQKQEIKIELNNLEYKPLISIIMPVYNVDLKWIKSAIKSINNQIYTNWELCIADDASTNPHLIRYLKKLSKNKKIQVVFRKKNGHISEASNSALKLAKGEYIALMDNDDIIHPHALAEVIKVLNENKNTDIIYSDEDKLDIDGKRIEPFFKPDWSPDLFMSTNYICHLTVIRKKLVDDEKGFRKGYEGSQDYDLLLRITEKTDKIKHIPDVLYSWRKIPGSTASEYSEKGYAQDTTIKALGDALQRRKMTGEVTAGLFPGSFRVRYNLVDQPLVSILIPTKDKVEYMKTCLSSLLEKTTYQNYEVIIIDTGSTEKNTLRYYDSLKNDSRIRFVKWDKRFNYSAVNNFGVKHSRGEYLILLNNDTEIITPDWIEGMLEHAQRKEVGAVGVKLLYPNDTIQHAGVVLGINGGTGRGVAGHAFKFFPREVQGFPVQKDIIRNYSAVTAACLMISRKKFDEVKGLEESFRIAFNDVDFCLKLMKRGYYNIYTPYVELYHHESISVGTPESNTRDNHEFGKEIDTMYDRWEKLLTNDPYYNANLSLKSEDFKLEMNPNCRF